jgi:Protein of unknown function (DUF2567)
LVDEHPAEQPQPGTPPVNGDVPPPDGPGPWPRDPQPPSHPQSAESPRAQPAQSFPPAQPYSQAAPFPQAEPTERTQPVPQGQPFSQGQPIPQGQPFSQGQPFPPSPAGQPFAQNLPGQGFPQGQPGQPFPPVPQNQAFPPSQPGQAFPPSQPGQPPYRAPGVYPGAGDGGVLLAGPPVASASAPWVERGDVRAAAMLAGALVVVGILAGVLWSMISPHGQGVVVSKTEIIPFEQENWIAADGRFALITAVIGLVVGAAAWFWRAQRGPVLVAGLAIGAGLGALLTALVGYWLSSGYDSGAVNTQIRLRVQVHSHGLIALEAVLAVAAYLVGVLFSGPDDLGRRSMAPDLETGTGTGTDAPPWPVEAGRLEAGASQAGFGSNRSDEGR